MVSSFHYCFKKCDRGTVLFCRTLQAIKCDKREPSPLSQKTNYNANGHPRR